MWIQGNVLIKLREYKCLNDLNAEKLFLCILEEGEFYGKRGN